MNMRNLNRSLSKDEQIAVSQNKERRCQVPIPSGMADRIAIYTGKYVKLEQ